MDIPYCRPAGGLNFPPLRSQILLSSCHLLGDRELLSAVHQLAPQSDASKLERLIATIQRRAKQLNLGASSRQHVILILDRVRYNCSGKNILWQSEMADPHSP